jgi:hypothetical protein
MNTFHLSLFLLLFSSFFDLAAIAQGLDTCRGSVTCDTTFLVNIHSSLPPYRVRMIEREDRSDGYPTWCYEIRAQRDTDSSPQVLIGKSISSFGDMTEEEYPGIQFIDLNFDGYQDIKMFNARAANGVNAGYAVYLFGPIDKMFHYSAKFSEILAGTAFGIDASKHLIYSEGELGCMGRCWSKETYKVAGDSLILIKRISQGQNSEHPGEFVLTVEELVSGKLAVVSKKIVKY